MRGTRGSRAIQVVPTIVWAFVSIAGGPLGCASLAADVAPARAASDIVRLERVLAAQPAETRARYPHRNPLQTLEFFGIAPGMTVVEVLPGGGWYSRVLVPYLGPEGRLIGADYAYEMVSQFSFMTPERLAAKKDWPEQWPAEAQAWRGDDGAEISAFVLGTLPAELEGSADAVLFIRALHNLFRFEAHGGFLTSALAEAYRVLAPGGIVGVVQHHARADMPDSWADGSAGYLKKRDVIAALEAAGFELVGESEINANPLDRPSTEDIVWRLPPSLSTSAQDPVLRKTLEAVGESNRMTLLFRKPQG